MSGVLGIHLEWEKNVVIRRRFQRETSWLQWPAPVPNQNPENEAEQEEGDEDVETHPICTKSLELNVEPITILMNYLHGNFANIDALKKEAAFADPFFPFYITSSQLPGSNQTIPLYNLALYIKYV